MLSSWPKFLINKLRQAVDCSQYSIYTTFYEELGVLSTYKHYFKHTFCVVKRLIETINYTPYAWRLILQPNHILKYWRASKIFKCGTISKNYLWSSGHQTVRVRISEGLPVHQFWMYGRTLRKYWLETGVNDDYRQINALAGCGINETLINPALGGAEWSLKNFEFIRKRKSKEEKTSKAIPLLKRPLIDYSSMGNPIGTKVLSRESQFCYIEETRCLKITMAAKSKNTIPSSCWHEGSEMTSLVGAKEGIILAPCVSCLFFLHKLV